MNMLTAREKEIFQFMIKGLNNTEIAEILVISKHTVKAHKENIYSKLKVHNTVQAVVKYYRINGSFD